MRYLIIPTVAALWVLSLGIAEAKVVHYAAALAGAQEVPSNTTTGKGKVSATLNTSSKAFKYSATYSGLTGPAVAAHFHGPAAPGANAPPTVPVAKPASPIQGSATLTDAQISDLQAGNWYFNVHTAANPSGEIRGQLKAAH